MDENLTGISMVPLEEFIRSGYKIPLHNIRGIRLRVQFEFKINKKCGFSVIYDIINSEKLTSLV